MRPGDRKRARTLPASPALEAILDSPQRERIPDARPIVPIDTGDTGDRGDAREEAAFRTAVEARMLGTTMLQRRDAWHGEWAELDPERLSSRALGRVVTLGKADALDH